MSVLRSFPSFKFVCCCVVPVLAWEFHLFLFMDRDVKFISRRFECVDNSFMCRRSSSAFDISFPNYCCLYYCVIDQNDESILITFSFLSLALCIALLQILLDNSWSIRSIPIGPSIEITTNQWLFYVSVYLLFFTKVISNIAFLLFAPGTLDDVRRRVSQTDLLWMCVRHYICVLHGASHMASNPSKKPTPVVPRVARCTLHTHNFVLNILSLFSHSTLLISPIHPSENVCRSALLFQKDFFFLSYGVSVRWDWNYETNMRSRQ